MNPPITVASPLQEIEGVSTRSSVERCPPSKKQVPVDARIRSHLLLDERARREDEKEGTIWEM
jgi:hypothetical protein